MSFLDKLRGELIDVVEWIDDSRHTLVWRFPRHQNEIKNGAQLIVRPGQVAAFVDQGKLADVFSPGMYTLTTDNLPVLSTIRGWKHGFVSPFKAEVYFISTRQLTELKWGTPKPIVFRDPDFGPVRLRAFGTYTLRATNPEALIAELVGTDAVFDAEEISILLRSIIGHEFAEVIARSGHSVIDLSANYRELSEQLRLAVQERLDRTYGLEIPQLYIVNVSLPDEVEQALDARTGMGIVGDLGEYQRYQIGHATPTLAANPAGGLAAAGAGVGMGLSMGQAMPAVAGASAGANAGSSTPPPAPPSAWYIVENGQRVGPLSMSGMEAAVSERRITATSLVWTAGLGDWTPAARVNELRALFASEPPPLPPTS